MPFLYMETGVKPVRAVQAFSALAFAAAAYKAADADADQAKDIAYRVGLAEAFEDRWLDLYDEAPGEAFWATWLNSDLHYVREDAMLVSAGGG